MTRPLTARDGYAAATIFLVVVLLYAPAMTFQFVNVDDQLYVPGNELVEGGLSWAGMKFAFTSVSEGNYIPVTWLSHMTVAELWGSEPAAHHAANVWLHALGAALLFLFLTTATGATGRSVVVTLLFALHPLRVESVAWVAERKDVLSGVFWMLVLLYYVYYIQKRTVLRYAIMWIVFALGLAAKSSLVTLPCVLLLLDIWPLDRVRTEEPEAGRRFVRLALEKAPLLALSVVFSAAAFIGQASFGAVASVHGVSLAERLWNAPASYAIYLYQTVWPWRLGVFYPYPGTRALYAWGGLGVALILGVTAAAVALRRGRPYLLVGWFWFLGTLVPVIGVVQVGEQGHADRYTFLAHIGLFIGAVWAIADLLGSKPASARWRAPIAAAAVLACAGLTWRQEWFWRNSFTLFEHTLAVTEPNHFAEGNYAGALMERGQYDEAETHLRRAMAIGPVTYRDQYNLGAALLYLGRTAEAVTLFDAALSAAPNDARGWALRGNALITLNRPNEAVESLQKALELGVKLPETRTNLAIARGMSGQFAASEELFLQILKGAPGNVGAMYNYGLLLMSHGDAARAATLFQRVVEQAPSHTEALYYLAAALANGTHAVDALDVLARAISLDASLQGRARADALFAPLRNVDRFNALVGTP